MSNQKCFNQNGNREPLVTIITVVYNGEAFLEETILSVINQSYKNIEYIIIDGASTDKTIEIIKKYEGHIDKWLSEPDKGIYDAMNKGIDLATGTWLNFMNAGDTFYSNDTLDVVFAKCNYYEVGFIYGNTDIRHKILTYKPDLSLNDMARGMMLCHQSAFYRLNNKIRYDLDYKLCGDQDFTMQYLQQGSKCVYLNKTISKYDLDGVSSQNLHRILKEKFRINKSYNLPYTPIVKSFIVSLLVKLRGLFKGY